MRWITAAPARLANIPHSVKRHAVCVTVKKAGGVKVARTSGVQALRNFKGRNSDDLIFGQNLGPLGATRNAG